MYASRQSLAACAVLALLATASAGAESTPVAAHIRKALQDARRREHAVAALRATEDKALLPVFIAALNAPPENSRLQAVAALAEMGGESPAAKAALAKQVRSESSPAVRQAALEALDELDACERETIATALAAGDEALRLSAARIAMRREQGDLAKPVLKQLAKSDDSDVAMHARVSLASMNEASHAEVLGKWLQSDPMASDEAIISLMTQIEKARTTALRKAAQAVAESRRSWEVRLAACRAWAAASGDAGDDVLAEAIRQCPRLSHRVRLFETLASRDDAKVQLGKFAAGNDELAALARFELARPAGALEANKAAAAVVNLEHPILIEYLLLRARQDVDAKGKRADFYAPVLLEIIDRAPAAMQRIRREHFHAARSATLLADLGTRRAVNGLKAALSGSYDGKVRSVTTGLLKTSNGDVRDLVSPFLKSPYAELATDAALILGRLGDRRAREKLNAIVAGSDRHATMLVTLASWYLVRIDARTETGAQELVRSLTTSQPSRETASD